MAFIKNSTYVLIGNGVPVHERWKGKPCMVHTSAVASSWEDTQTDNNERYHVDYNGWKNAGYIYSIEVDGRCFYSETTGYKQYHCYGQNTKSFGICLIGDGTKQEPTIEQINMLRKILKATECNEIRYHRDFSKKACPGEAVMRTLEAFDDLKAMVKRF